LCSGALDICKTPENGWLSSRIRKIAQAADKAKSSNEPITMALGEAKRLKLAKMMVSQNTKIPRKRPGIGLRVCAKAANGLALNRY
jgi:hypothetical protein